MVRRSVKNDWSPNFLYPYGETAFVSPKEIGSVFMVTVSRNLLL